METSSKRIVIFTDEERKLFGKHSSYGLQPPYLSNEMDQEYLKKELERFIEAFELYRDYYGIAQGMLKELDFQWINIQA